MSWVFKIPRFDVLFDENSSGPARDYSRVTGAFDELVKAVGRAEMLVKVKAEDKAWPLMITCFESLHYFFWKNL